MATADDLIALRQQMVAQLQTILQQPKPSYNVDGQQVSWTEYQKMLLSEIHKIEDQLALDEPFESLTQGYT